VKLLPVELLMQRSVQHLGVSVFVRELDTSFAAWQCGDRAAGQGRSMLPRARSDALIGLL